MLLLPGALQIAQMGVLVHLVREMMQQMQVLSAMQKSNLLLEAVIKLFLWRSGSVHVVDVCLRRSNLHRLLSVVEGVCWVGFTIRKNTGAPKDGDTSA